MFKIETAKETNKGEGRGGRKAKNKKKSESAERRRIIIIKKKSFHFVFFQYYISIENRIYIREKTTISYFK